MEDKRYQLEQYKSNHPEYAEYKTERQWALAGMVVSGDAKGIDLYSNLSSRHLYRYYSPAEVVPGTREQLYAYFRPARERATDRQRQRRMAKRIQQADEIAAQERLLRQEQALKELQQRREIASAVMQPAVYYPSVHRDAIIIDTETTGLDPTKSELLQVAIIDVSGDVLFNRYFRPTSVETWPEAEAVNGITPGMVEDAPPVWKHIREIRDIVSNTDEIVGYNTWFDLDMLAAEGVDRGNTHVIDVMKAFATVYGERNTRGEYRWQKLTIAADYYGYDWSAVPGTAHNALADCYATLHVYKSILAQEPEVAAYYGWGVPPVLQLF